MRKDEKSGKNAKKVLTFCFRFDNISKRLRDRRNNTKQTGREHFLREEKVLDKEFRMCYSDMVASSDEGITDQFLEKEFEKVLDKAS